MAAGRDGKWKRMVVDGADIRELVENAADFTKFADHKFHDLDLNRDGKLAVKELQPAIADIGSVLGLPPPGTAPDSDHIYNEVLNEFTHGKQGEVSKSEFKRVLSDILLGVAAGLKRDPIVLLRIDGEDLVGFITSSQFEPHMASIFSSMESDSVTLHDSVKRALGQLTVEQGMPPAYDSWVLENIIEPALHIHAADDPENPVSQETFEEFKKVTYSISQHLRQKPVIVAHTENTFDGNGIRTLLADKVEFDKVLNEVWRDFPKDRHQKVTTEYIRVGLDRMAASARLPPYGAVAQVDTVIVEAFKMMNCDDGKAMEKEDFKKMMAMILGSIMLQLEGNPISVSSNKVVHETMPPSSVLLSP